jgi:hypothetical protein
MVTSISTIVLVILCIGVFIFYGAHLAFYAISALTLVVGLTNAWLIANSAKAGKPAAVVSKTKAEPKKKRRKR